MLVAATQSEAPIATDPRTRRVLVEIPPDCPLSADALSWALSGQSPGIDPNTGEVLAPALEDAVLTPADDFSMAKHYGIESEGGRRARRWHTVTPVALPVQRRRGKLTGSERADDERHAAGAVAAALRHAGHDPRGAGIRLQAEPFFAKGERAERFEPQDEAMRQRFAGRLRHVEITFAEPVSGPLVIGDGRYLGLGLMAPARWEEPSVLHLFAIDPATAPPAAAAEAVAKALSRAVMARADAEWKARHGRAERLPKFFTGHEPDGRPARSGRHEHLFFLADDADGDGRLDRLAVIAPWLADRSPASSPKKRQEEDGETRGYLRMLDRALAGLTLLRAGRAGLLRLSRRADAPGENDALFGRARLWTSRTAYQPTRHPSRMSTEDAVRLDILEECARRGLARPEDVEVLRVETGPRGGLTAGARLTFRRAVCGPLLLGRGSHFGAGLFRAE